MNILKRPSLRRTGSILCFSVLSALGAGVFHAGAQSFILSQKDSTAQIDLSSGLSNWQVDGVNQVNQQGFYFSVGNTQAEPISTIAAPSNVSTSAITPTVTATYANVNGPISVTTKYQLTGQASGSGQAKLLETITVKNTSAFAQDFHLYQYSDFDLGGVTGNQNAVFFNNGSGAYQLTQTGAATTLNESAAAPAASSSEVQAGLLDATLLGLANAGLTTFNDTLSAGPGNVVYGYEWDAASLAPNSSYQVSITLSVPEPSVLAILSTGAIGLSLIRRRSRKA